MKLVNIEDGLDLLEMRTNTKEGRLYVYFSNGMPLAVIDTETETMGCVSGATGDDTIRNFPKVVAHASEVLMKGEDWEYKDAVFLPRTMVYSSIYEPLIPTKKKTEKSMLEKIEETMSASV